MVYYINRFNRRTRGLKSKLKKQRIINLIIFCVCLIFCIGVGYSAFQTNITLTARANVSCKRITVKNLKNNLVSSGSGLYEDSTENNRYIYREVVQTIIFY